MPKGLDLLETLKDLTLTFFLGGGADCANIYCQMATSNKKVSVGLKFLDFPLFRVLIFSVGVRLEGKNRFL